MDARISAEDWKSTAMIRAENDLYDAIDRAGKRITEADRLMAELDEKEKAGTAVNGIEALKAWATGPDAPEVLRAAIEDVRAGRLSRQQALSDPAITADPVLVVALEAVTRPDAELPAGRWARRRRDDPPAGYDPEDFSTHDLRNM